MKTKKNVNKNRIKGYQEAFIKYLGSDKEKFETKEYWKGGPVLIRYKDDVYRVDSYADMYDFFKDSLTDIDPAMHIPLVHWIDVAEEVHVESKFIENLIDKLDEESEFIHLNMALNICKYASKDSSVFWKTVYSLDDIGLYPKAIIAACETYELESMIQELMEYMVSDGENCFTQMKDGIFETIDLDEDDASNEGLYYIYTYDPISWEVADKE